MGYHSEVALAIRVDHEKDMLADQDIAAVLSWADTSLRSKDGSCLLFHWGCIKWYDDTDHQIGALMRFLANINDSEDFIFIRLGEDDSDTDIRGGWYDNPFEMEAVRRIEFTNTSAPSARIVDLKGLNTRPEAAACAQCGAQLSDPVPGMPSMKHCPVCEP